MQILNYNKLNFSILLPVSTLYDIYLAYKCILVENNLQVSICIIVQKSKIMTMIRILKGILFPLELTLMNNEREKSKHENYSSCHYPFVGLAWLTLITL